MSAPVHASLLAEAEPARPPRTIDRARAVIRAGLAEARGGAGLLAITVGVRAREIEAPLRAIRKGPSWVIAPAEGAVAVAGIGRTRAIALTGETRLDLAKETTSELFREVATRVEDGALAMPLRAFVGLSFAPGSATAAPWEPFGDGMLIVPRWTYASEGGRASLTLAVDRARPIEERLALAELEAILGALEDPARDPASVPAIARIEHLDRTRWDDAIEAIGARIAAGEARKIVASRRTIVTAATDLDPLEILARLEDPRSPSTRFLVRSGHASFVGATPEHLFVQRGPRIATEALAGSIASTADRAHERLLESAKEREEHELVVRHILERLAPLCSRIARPDSPQLRRLPTVIHLRTAIEGELARRTDPIDVIAALHPTPAVGGTPSAQALDWIRTQEPAARGWYGAPLGWIDASGDADFVVALRCGVIQGARAWLYAGGGIVAGSRAEDEWEETTLKMRPMLRAIGAEP